MAIWLNFQLAITLTATATPELKSQLLTKETLYAQNTSKLQPAKEMSPFL